MTFRRNPAHALRRYAGVRYDHAALLWRVHDAINELGRMLFNESASDDASFALGRWLAALCIYNNDLPATLVSPAVDDSSYVEACEITRQMIEAAIPAKDYAEYVRFEEQLYTIDPAALEDAA